MRSDWYEKLKYIETHYAVENIKYKSILLWPYLRSLLFAYYEVKPKEDTNTQIDRMNNRSVKLCFSILKRCISGFFRTDFSLFSNTGKVLLFTDSAASVAVEGKIIDKFSCALADEYKDLIPVLAHTKKNMAYTHFVDRDFIDNFIVLRYLFLHISEQDIIGSEIFESVCKELGITLDLTRTVRHILKIQKFYLKLFLKIKPDKIFMTWYYEVYKIAIIDIAHQIGIPVIELQHGIYAFAYAGFKNIQGAAYPDYFFCFGPSYVKTISPAIYAPERIKIVGYYYMDLIRQREKEGKLLFDSKYSEKAKGKTIITVASQWTIDRKLLNFYSELAENNKNLLVIFKPRLHEEYHDSYCTENFIIEDELDVYVCMQNSSVVSTVYSTCGLEALCFGKPLLLIDIEGFSTLYFKSLIGEPNFVKYTSRLDEAADFIFRGSKFDSKKIEQLGEKFYAAHHSVLLKQALKEIC